MKSSSACRILFVLDGLDVSGLMLVIKWSRYRLWNGNIFPNNVLDDDVIDNG